MNGYAKNRADLHTFQKELDIFVFHNKMVNIELPLLVDPKNRTTNLWTCEFASPPCITHEFKLQMLNESQSFDTLYYTLFKRMYTFGDASLVDILIPQEKDKIFGNISSIVFTLAQNVSYAWRFNYSEVPIIQTSPFLTDIMTLNNTSFNSSNSELTLDGNATVQNQSLDGNNSESDNSSENNSAFNQNDFQENTFLTNDANDSNETYFQNETTDINISPGNDETLNASDSQSPTNEGLASIASSLASPPSRYGQVNASDATIGGNSDFNQTLITTYNLTNSSQNLIGNDTNTSQTLMNTSMVKPFQLNESHLCLCFNTSFCDCTSIPALFGLKSSIFQNLNFFLYGKPTNPVVADEFVVSNYLTLDDINVLVKVHDFQKETEFFNFTMIFQEEVDPIFINSDEKFSKSISKFLVRMGAILAFFLFMLISDW